MKTLLLEKNKWFRFNPSDGPVRDFRQNWVVWRKEVSCWVSILQQVFRQSVLVHLGCCNKAPWTGQLINNRHLISCSFRGWKSKIRVPVWSGKAPFWAADFSLYPHMAERRWALWGTLCKGTKSIHEGLWPNDLIRPHFLITSHWRLGFQHKNLAIGDINIQFIIVSRKCKSTCFL